MKGYRFYEEFATKADKRKGISSGNVVALWLNPDDYGHNNPWQVWHRKDDGSYYASGEGFSAIFFHADSDVSWNTFSRDYLAENCKRISERRAREIHPRLFALLDKA